MAVCALRKVSKSYRCGFLLRRTRVLSEITFQVEPGETFAYLGHNGAGKTTTIKALLGLIRVDAGDVELCGGSPRDRRSRARVGYLPENPYFYDHLTATELLHLVADLHGLPRREARRRVGELLDRVGLAAVGHRRLRACSKGMLQRLGLAQAMINEPELLILDEPMSGLDPVGRRDIRGLLGELKERGTTLFLSSHILSDVEAIADRAAILSHGRLCRIVRMADLNYYNRSMVVHCRGIRGDAMTALETAGLKVARRNDAVRILVDDRDRLPWVLQSVFRGGGRLLQVVPQRETLEDVFLREVGASEQGVGVGPEESPPAGGHVAEPAVAPREEVRR